MDLGHGVFHRVLMKKPAGRVLLFPQASLLLSSLSELLGENKDGETAGVYPGIRAEQGREEFIRQLIYMRISFAAIANNRVEQEAARTKLHQHDSYRYKG